MSNFLSCYDEILSFFSEGPHVNVIKWNKYESLSLMLDLVVKQNDVVLTSVMSFPVQSDAYFFHLQNKFALLVFNMSIAVFALQFPHIKKKAKNVFFLNAGQLKKDFVMSNCNSSGVNADNDSVTGSTELNNVKNKGLTAVLQCLLNANLLKFMFLNNGFTKFDDVWKFFHELICSLITSLITRQEQLPYYFESKLTNTLVQLFGSSPPSSIIKDTICSFIQFLSSFQEKNVLTVRAFDMLQFMVLEPHSDFCMLLFHEKQGS